ncbi:hypothetical protein DL546_005618 [Coniochaeta pulveracea]|uniref:Oxidoreductase acuF-like C2H2 type zinc-finger domain-containing protein n=1 Tax=Coniochaeta pulveracea TaxID=177199 RepID=A0A420YI20_9PEZI|nr:hypothetical protein DL546_005618 [Coniochaeta pulveracea]
MNSICTTLLERLSPLHPTIDMGGIASSLRRTIEEAADRLEESYQDDDSRSSTSAASWAMTQDNIDEIIRDLEADVECLRNLDPLLMLRSTRAHTAHAGTNTWIPYQAICDSIANMFPEAQEATVHRVGKAMWDSFLRCMRLRHSNEKSDTVDIVEVARTVFTLSSTPWTEQTKDSGLGSSIATGAENLAFYAQLDDDTIDIPPLPEQAQKGEPFDCIACGRQVRIRNASAWRAHLFSDLRPYVCPFDGCHASSVGPGTRLEFCAHLQLTHAMLFVGDEALRCPLCCGSMDPGLLYVTSHLSKHLEELALRPLKMDADVDSDYDGKMRNPSGQSVSATGSSSLSAETSHISNRANVGLGHIQRLEPTTPADSILRYDRRAGSASDSADTSSVFTRRTQYSTSSLAPPVRAGPEESSFIQQLNMQAAADYGILAREGFVEIPPIHDMDHNVLWCELRDLCGCPAEFSIADTDLWIEHHRVDHLGDRFPSRLVCWFCDHVPFVAAHKRDRYSNFVNRMQHIRQHIWDEYKVPDDMRPDYLMITHLRELGIISKDVYDTAMGYSELPASLRLPDRSSGCSDPAEPRTSSYMPDLRRERRPPRARGHHTHRGSS